MEPWCEEWFFLENQKILKRIKKLLSNRIRIFYIVNFFNFLKFTFQIFLFDKNQNLLFDKKTKIDHYGKVKKKHTQM